MAEGGPAAITWDRVLAVVATVAAIDDPTSFGRRALESIAEAVPYDLGSFNEIDTSVPTAVFSAVPEDWSPDADIEAFPRLIGENPILRYQQRTGDLGARRISDFMSADELHRLALYQRVYRPLGVEYQVAIGLAAKEPLVLAFALSRSHADFGNPELAVLDVLRPHLMQAYRNLQALAALQGIDRALAQVGRAVVVLGAGGVEGRMPPWADEALDAHFGPPTAGGLPEAVDRWLDEERRGVLHDGRPRINRPLASVAGGRQLVVRFVPGAGPRPDVLLIDERAPDREATELRRLGLTAREAEILALLMHGATTVGAAQRLRVSAATLSKHLQHIYRKLGVTSRSAAIAAASDAIFSFR